MSHPQMKYQYSICTC